jgi:hypothetical protein
MKKKKILGLYIFRFVFVMIFAVCGISTLVFGTGGERFLGLIPLFFIPYSYSKQIMDNDWERYHEETDPKRKEEIANEIYIRELRKYGGGY